MKTIAELAQEERNLADARYSNFPMDGIGDDSPSIESTIVEADEFVNLVLPEKRVILNPWLTEGSISLVVGWRGVGKTWFELGKLNAITRGISFGPWETSHPIPCLFVDGEMPAQDVQERLKSLTCDETRKTPLYILSDAYSNLQGFPKSNLLREEWRNELKQIVIDKGIKVVTLDNISSLAPGIDENSKDQWDPINQWLLELRFHGVSSTLLHHTGKEGDQRGTSGREDNLDNSITLRHPPGYTADEGAKFTVKFTKTRCRAKDLHLIADLEFSLIEVDERLQWAWGYTKRKNQIEILRMIDKGGLSQSEIARILGIDRAYVSRIKSSAMHDGYLTKWGKLTPSGFDLVNFDEGELIE